MYKDIYDIWFLGSYWLSGVVRGDFVKLVVGSQEPSDEWVKDTIDKKTSIIRAKSGITYAFLTSEKGKLLYCSKKWLVLKCPL